MSADLSANVGLANTAAKQYQVLSQVRANNGKVEDEGSARNEKGMVSDGQIVDMASPTIDEYVVAMTKQDGVQEAKKQLQPTIEFLKERLERSFEDRFDNAHNMLAEAFYSFKVSTCNSLLGVLGADPADLEAIKKRAYEQAKEKVQAGYERLASAYAEYEIYAS
ncbi:MAG: hypothetical protein ABH860_02090 [bacterium]